MKCSDDKFTFSEAQQKCEEIGARLCKKEEYTSGAGARSGCVLDTKSVWTSTVCDGGHIAVMINKQPGEAVIKCESDNTSLSGPRCCADVAGCRQR